MIKSYLFFCIFILCSSLSLARSESGPGNGTDYVKVLFADAQYHLLSAVSQIQDEDLKTLELDKDIQDWLLVVSNKERSRWSVLKNYLKIMDFRFQQEPCTDFTKKPASICFFNDKVEGPYVVISLKENKMTTKDQAMVMLIHEAGHFTGEKDHEFLDQVGVQLVSALQAPTILIADESISEIVPVPQVAKEGCDKGTSDLAKQLKKKILMNLKVQCQKKQLSCNSKNTEFAFKGTVNFKEGVGFDMTVTCEGRGILPLR